MNSYRTRNLLVRLAVALLTLGIFSLYLRYLGRQSLWFDEGLSVLFAARPVPQLLHTLIYEDLHPPLYYLLLHFWMALAGSSEWAVRMPSLFAAVLLVPLSFAIVREIWGQGTQASTAWHALGISAAALVGASPFIAYYAQETRMYTLAAMLVLVTTWAFLKATRTASPKWWLVFSCFLAASWYVQYFSAFVVPAFLLYAFLLDRRFLRRTVLHCLLAVLMYIPWVVPVYMQLGRLIRTPDYWVTTRIDPAWFARTMWTAFLPSTPARSWLLAIVVGVLVLARLAQRALARGKLHFSDPVRRTALVFLTFLIPLVLTYAAVSIAPKFATRYSIIAATPLYLCAVMALYAVLGRRSLAARGVFGIAVLLAVALSLRSTVAVTAGRENPRDDARGLAAYLTANAQANDALLLVESAPYALEYYYHGAAPWYGLHVGQDISGTAGVLNGILQTQPRRIWLVLWHYEFADPMDVAVTELLRIGREVDIPQQFLGYRLRAFDIEQQGELATAHLKPQVAIDADFGSGLRFLGFDRFSHDGGWLHYVLYWQAQQLLERNCSLTLNLEDRDGNEYLRQDQALSTPYFLPPAWPLQTPIQGRVDVLLPADLPAITYRVHLRVLDPETQRNLDMLDAQGNPLGQALLLEELSLSKGALASTPVSVKNPLGVEMTDHLQLLGYELTTTTISPGDTLPLTLWWQSSDRPTQDHQARFRLLDNRKGVIWEAEQPLVLGYSTARWQAGEVNRGVYRLAIPSRVPGGEYSLQAGIEDEQIALAAVEIVAREHRYDLPAMQHSVGAQFESGVLLLGYDLQAPAIQPGQSITVTLYWQAKQAISTSYKISVQILESGPRIVTQDDSIPAHWTRPTTAWLLGEIITDEHVLSIPSGAAPGTWTLIAAVYEEGTSQRLRVKQGGTRDYVTLTTLHSQP
jgi:mannosyltransferase